MIPRIDSLYNITPEEIEIAKNRYLQTVERDDSLIKTGLESQLNTRPNIADGTTHSNKK